MTERHARDRALCGMAQRQAELAGAKLEDKKQ